MAVKAKNMPITREDVYSWIGEWKTSKSSEKLDKWIRSKVDGLKLEDPFVNTEGHDTLPDQVHVADLIMMDISTFDNYAPDS